MYSSVPLEICGRGRKKDRESTFLFMKMKEELTFLTQKDLCMIEHIPELIDAGIDSLKIEGRMKTALYVGDSGKDVPKSNR